MAHRLNFLDCNCGVGPCAGAGPTYDGSVATLVRTMDSLGIAEACPFALSQYECMPGTGNAWLAQAVKGESRLHPVLVVGPNACGEFIGPEALPERMAACGARMVRLPLGPLSTQQELQVCLIADLLDCMAQHRVAIIIDCLTSLEQVRTDELLTLLRTWPVVHVILSFPKLGSDNRRFYYLWERFPNLHVELSGYQTLGGIEAVTKRFGNHRIVFGTRYPHFAPLQTVLQVIYADVEESVKREIAGGTVRQFAREAVL